MQVESARTIAPIHPIAGKPENAADNAFSSVLKSIVKGDDNEAASEKFHGWPGGESSSDAAYSEAVSVAQAPAPADSLPNAAPSSNEPEIGLPEQGEARRNSGVVALQTSVQPPQHMPTGDALFVGSERAGPGQTVSAAEQGQPGSTYAIAQDEHRRPAQAQGSDVHAPAVQGLNAAGSSGFPAGTTIAVPGSKHAETIGKEQMTGMPPTSSDRTLPAHAGRGSPSEGRDTQSFTQGVDPVKRALSHGLPGFWSRSPIHVFLSGQEGAASGPFDYRHVPSLPILAAFMAEPAASALPDRAASSSLAPAQLGQQIVQAAVRLADGAVDLRLEPEELGRLRLSLMPEGDKMRILILADRPETLELLRRHSAELDRDLRALGYGSTEFSFAGQDRSFHGSTNSDSSLIAIAASGGDRQDQSPAAPFLAAPGRLNLRL